MSQNLKNDKTRAIFQRIERDKQEIRDSISHIKSSFATAKNDVSNVTQNIKNDPLSLILPEDSKLRQLSVPRLVSNHPLAVAAGSIAVGWLAARAMKKSNIQVGRLLGSSAKNMASGLAATPIASRIVEKLTSAAEEVIDNLVTNVKNKVPGAQAEQHESQNLRDQSIYH